MTFKSRAKAILGNVREGVEKDEETKERASARREAAKARLKQAYRAIEAAEPGVADGSRDGRKTSRTQAMFARAENLGQASAPVDATLETMGDPGQIEAFATAGDSGTPQGQDDGDGMAAGMEALVLGVAGDEPETAEKEPNEPLEFDDPFGVSGGDR